MNYSITPVADDGYILIEVHGVINRWIGKRFSLEAHALGKRLGIGKYLVDVTDAVNNDSTLDQYRFANTDIMGSAGFDRLARVATLVAPDDHSHDFIETVCRNIGLDMRIFRNRHEAMSFLGLEVKSSKLSL